MAELGKTIVLDMGSREARVGFSGEDEPRVVVTSVVGRPKHVGAMTGAGFQDFYVGSDAEARRGVLEMRYPVENGAVVHWDDWERLVQRMVQKTLAAKWEEHPILFSAPLYSPHANEQKLAEVLFETFHVPALGGALAPALALWGTCQASGLVVQLGHDLTQIVPIYDNKIIEEAACRTELAGAAQTRYLATILTENSKKFNDPTSADLLYNLDGLKRTCCYTATNFAEEIDAYEASPAKNLEYTFSDGRTHLLRTERFRVGELLFKPKIAGYETKPLHKLVYKTLMKCPMDLRKTLASNISLAGGASLLPGLPQRLEAELMAMLPAGNHIHINSPKERLHTTWRGGALLASFSSWSSHLFTKQAYEEHGAAAVHRYGFLNTQLSQK